MRIKLLSYYLIAAVICKLTNQQSLDQVYDSCDEQMRCFGMPEGCIERKSCDVLLTATPQSCQCGGADFQLYWNRDNSSQNNWVGAALSSDRKMGNDSVTECILWKNKTVTARQGMTFGGNDHGVKTVEPIAGITNETGDYKDGVVRCGWNRTVDTNVTDFDFNILQDKFYIFLAYGPLLSDDLQKHVDTWVSKEAEYLGAPLPNATTTTVTESTTMSSTSKNTTATETEATNSTHSGPTNTGNTHTGPTNMTETTPTPKPTTSKPETTTKGSANSMQISIIYIILISFSIVLFIL